MEWIVVELAGKHKTFEWRGKPVFVWHRDADQIAAEQAVR